MYEAAGAITGVGEIMPLNQLRGTVVLEGEKKNIHVFFTLTPERDPLIQQVRMWTVDKTVNGRR